MARVGFGLIRPDAGVLRVNGAAVHFASPADAIAHGIGITNAGVHQHFSLVPAMTVTENIALGMRGRYDASKAAERVRELGARTELLLDPAIPAGELPVSAQQRLEILKALSRQAQILILDEPTAVLAPSEGDELFEWVRRFRRDGNSVILITHKLREALNVADDITVLRHGTTVSTGAASTFDEPALVRSILGEQLSVDTVSRLTHGAGDVVLSARDVWVRSGRGAFVLQNVSLHVRAGEIVGITAIEGSGQHALMQVLSGRLPPAKGAVTVPRDVAFVPEDRHRDALVLDMTPTENVALRDLAGRHGRMPWSALRDTTVRTLSRFQVRTAGPESFARELSGGNQQKLVLRREIGMRPRAIVAENPCRGLDVRATSAIHLHLRAARDAGSAVLLYSSDLDEVLSLSDRIVVVHAGGVREVQGTREEIGRVMLGAG